MEFNQFMNMPEGKLQQETSEHTERRTQMVDPCYYCLCNSCINNAESATVNLERDKFPDDWEACFFCDDCRGFDGDTAKRNMEREQCAGYEIDSYHAQQNRKRIRLVKRR